MDFPKKQVRTAGTSKAYVRGSDSGRKIKFNFCLNWGATVFWNAEFLPDLLGTFADPSMPYPTVSLWETTRHHWMTFDHELARSGRQVAWGEGAVTVRR